MLRSRAWLPALLMASTLASACADAVQERIHNSTSSLAGQLPPCKVDVEASEVSVTAETGKQSGFLDEGNQYYAADQLRADIAQALEAACSEAATTTATPVRFRIRGSAFGSESVIWVTGLPTIILALVPVPFGDGSAHLTLDVQFGNTIYTAKSEASVLHGMYYNWGPADAAFADALEDAVRKIVAQMKARQEHAGAEAKL